MNYQKVIIGAAIGSAVVGLGFLLFHPAGKNIRRKAVDIGLDAADKIIELLRTQATTAADAETSESDGSSSTRQRTAQPVTEM